MKTKKFKMGPMQKRWIKALKSGNYKQCKGELCSDKTGGYCCLGVANECLALGQVGNEVLSDTYHKLGLRDGDGGIIPSYKFPSGNINHKYLSQMNDSGVTHAKIAEFIEQNPQLVFTHSV